MDVRDETDAHYLNVERAAVRSIGGTPNTKLNGPDGRTNGIISRPIEIKYADKDARFRVSKSNHLQMLRQDGIYVFKLEDGRSQQMSARDADRLLKYDWLSDKRSNGQNYEHSFIFKSDVFR
jgi:hypothetical protein